MYRFEPKKRITTTESVSQSNFYGRYLFKPGVQVNEVFVPYFSGCLIFKMIPGQNPEDGGATLDPLVLPGTRIFGSWQTTVPFVSCGKGDKRINYCPWTEYGNSAGLETTPYALVYKLVSDMKKRPQGDPNRVDSWLTLMYDGNKSGGATLTKMSSHTLLFCAPAYKNTDVYDMSRTRKWLHVLNLSPAGARALRNMLDELIDSGENIDPLDFKTGPFIQMFSGRAGDPETNDGGDPESKEYFARLTPYVPNTNITCDVSAYAEDYKELLRPWDYLIQCPSKEQQATWLMDVLPPDLLSQAWRDSVGEYYPFVTAELAKRLEIGCQKVWQQKMAQVSAEMSRFAPVTPTLQPIMTQPVMQQPVQPVIPQQSVQPQQTVKPMEPPKPVTNGGAIPGLIKRPGYAPVPPQYNNMMSDDVPFDMPGEDLEQL